MNRRPVRHGRHVPAGAGRAHQRDGACPASRAEFVQIGAVRMDEPRGYDVIVDRISHDIPFYRAYLKNAALCGTTVINNPFWWSADDKFFNYALATRLGVAIPPTVMLPHKQHPTGTTERSMRNLQYPLDWDDGLRVRRLPGVPEAVRRRRLAGRLQGRHAGGVLRRLRPDRHAVHDAAARASTSRSTSAATSSGRSRCTSCPTTRARRSTSATCRTRRPTIRRCSRASSATR